MEFIPYLIAVVVLYVVLKLFSLPMKIIMRFIINAIIGGVVIFALSLFGIGITITWLSAVIVGFLGIPGVIIVLIMQFLF